MKVFNAAGFAGRATVLAVVVTAALGGAAAAAVSMLTLDPSAQLSPGRLHAHLTGTVTCDPGKDVSLSGQVIQSGQASGYGFTALACDGAQQAYTIDVATGGGFPGIAAGVFKPGKASAQVTTTDCEVPLPFPENCTTTYTDAIIRLKK
jgi:hypothetical protein